MRPDKNSLVNSNMTSDKGGGSSGINDNHNNSVYSLTSDCGSNCDLKAQIITKFHNTSSFLSGIVSERKNRNDYEDLDKIDRIDRIDRVYHQHQQPKTSTAAASTIPKVKTLADFSFYQNYHNYDQNILNDGEPKSRYDINKIKSVPDFTVNNFTSIKDHFTSHPLYDDRFYYDNEDVIFEKPSKVAPATATSSAKIWQCCSWLQESKKENVLLLIYICVYVLFLLLGGFIFHYFESPIEHKTRELFRSTRMEFIQKYPEIEDDDLENFLAEVIKANDRGISPLRNASSESNWGFGQALFFSSTVVTTIGYGHVTPLSQTGKIFCMIYATIGIPLTLVLLTAVVERLLIPANWLLGSLNTKLGHLYQPFNIRLLHLFIIATIVGTLFFAIPTATFAYLEPSWNVLDAFYYCFISMTTIGLGDYIPGEGVSPDNRSIYKICITIYLITGLIAMMLALTVFYDIPQLNLGQLFTENTTGETEKLRLSGSSAPCYSGPSGLYIPQRDEDMRRNVVRIRPHGDESPTSPDEQQPPSLHRDMRVP